MSDNSKIEWTEATWNPVTGCTKISPGCKYCYAERMARRLQAMGQHRYRNGFRVTLQEDLVDLPRKWKEGRRIFVNSMSDLFHAEVPFDFIQRCFDTMREADQHTYQVLTKRPERMLEFALEALEGPWPPQVWAGTSVENADYKWRIDMLRGVPASTRFLSIEPLIGPMGNLDLEGIHWVIVGGESGPQARPMEAEWAREVRDQCHEAGVAFFFKQWGGTRKKLTGRILDGRTWDEYPLSLPKNRLTSSETSFSNSIRLATQV
ncbi:MAG: phage Gp37/Gp68 family protein [Euryarchaeota archaeon]|nr:phage Gp37/Gp68 family protein [Euryarchaeota archaeon]